jgi:hypothetical protein
VQAPIARAGEQMAKPAPKLYLLAYGLAELGLPVGFFNYKPPAVAFGRPGGDGDGVDAVTLCSPLCMIDNPNQARPPNLRRQHQHISLRAGRRDLRSLAAQRAAGL